MKPFQKAFYFWAGKCFTIFSVLGFEYIHPPLFCLPKNNVHFREECLNFLFLVRLGSLCHFGFCFLCASSGWCGFFPSLFKKKERKTNIPFKVLNWGISFEFPASLPWTSWVSLGRSSCLLKLSWTSLSAHVNIFRVQLNYTHCTSCRWKLLLPLFYS